MNILFITSSRIGDGVLSFGLLDYLSKKYPDARFTIGCGPLVVSLLEGFEPAERIIPIEKRRFNRHWLEFWLAVKGTKYDIVVDLRNSAVSRVVRTKERFVFDRYIDKSKHKVEQNASVLKLADPPAPKLWFSAEQLKKAKKLIPEGKPVLGIGPSANWIGKTWHAERFIDVINWLISDGGLMGGARVAVFAAPGEENAAREVLASIPEGRAIDLIAKTDPGMAAACLSLCNFYLGNDSGLMHCAAAASVPTFGVFGPSYPHIYRPWGNHTDFARTPETFDELIDFEGYDPKTCGNLMDSLSAEAVKNAIKDSWPKITARS
ncbi:MAG: glycosyltransferase family 9 protein [Alphaproteobacteria bacterium]|nr:glycosyltransferase family 9 protein [Alphaproteobacteria bacterium]